MKEVSRRTYKRVLALALVFTMLLGMPGLTVLAAQDDPRSCGGPGPAGAAAVV